MNIVMTTQLTEEQKAAIMQLWNAEYPAQLGYKEMSYFDNYLAALLHQRHWLYYDANGSLRGWAFTFEREHDTWFAIIVDRTLHRKGIGTTLLNRLKQHHTLLNGWVTDHDSYNKQDGTPYPSPMPFYLANGFIVCPETRLEIEVLSAVKIQWKPGNG